MAVLYDDILLLMLDHIVDTKDRLRLLLVYRHRYATFLPEAYERIRVQGDHIYWLVCSIQRNPRIGSAIHDLSVGACPLSSWASIDYEMEMCKNAVQQASTFMDHYTNWEDSLLAGDSDAWLAVLAPSLENIRWLEIEYGDWPDYFLHILVRAAAREKPFDLKPGFRRLETMRVRNDPNDPEATFAGDFLPLFQFSAMRVLSITSLCEKPEPDAPKCPKPAPGTSGITELEFLDCNGRNGMAAYITSCANLEVFDYQHQNKALWGNAYYSFLSLKFYTSLYTQGHSLRVLRLNNNGDIDGEYDWSDDNGVDYSCVDYSSFGSLVEFHQLRELRMPLRPLLQFARNDQPTVSLLEVLQTSLEHLQLAGYRDRDFDVVEENLQRMFAHREQFPNLKRIEIQPVVLESGLPASYDYKIPDSVTRAFAPLKMNCDQLGIEFDFTKDGNHTISGAGHYWYYQR
ncbi:hypothetical protein N7486_000994 [Penicillium sp. IBT 16267x]|nr:hypothetical protein N7486_000994 [Penicillium sp. IBT 16267x]